MYTLLFFTSLLLDFSTPPVLFLTSVLSTLLASTDWGAVGCEGTGGCGWLSVSALLLESWRLTQMERSFRFILSVQSQSSMLATILATRSPQYSSTSSTRSLMTESRMSQLSESQHSSLGSSVQTYSKTMPNVNTLLFSSISSSTTSSSPQRKAMINSGEGSTGVPSRSFWQVLRQMSQFGRSLKLPWSQKIFSGSTSLQVTPWVCRCANAQMTPSISRSMSYARKSLLVCRRPYRSCFRVNSTAYRKRTSCSVSISMQFLNGVACNLSTPSHSTLRGRGAVRAGVGVGLLEGWQLMLRGEVLWESCGLLSYWPIANEYIMIYFPGKSAYIGEKGICGIDGNTSDMPKPKGHKTRKAIMHPYQRQD